MARARPTDPSPLQAAIAEAIDRAPQARDYYDREIQRLTNSTGKLLYDIERGKTKNPGVEKLVMIARVFGLPDDHFFAASPTASTAQPFQMEGASARRMRPDLPIYGTALGAEEIIDGEAIEQTNLNSGEIVRYVSRPVLLEGRADAYGIYVQGSSMVPRFRDGATLFVERKRPARIGDDVVVYLRGPDDQAGERTQCVLVKELVRRTANYIELKQYTPEITFRIDAARVERIDRVIPWDDLIG